MSLINREEAIEKIMRSVVMTNDMFGQGIAHGLRAAVVILQGLPDAEEKK